MTSRRNEGGDPNMVQKDRDRKLSRRELAEDKKPRKDVDKDARQIERMGRYSHGAKTKTKKERRKASHDLKSSSKPRQSSDAHNLAQELDEQLKYRASSRDISRALAKVYDQMSCDHPDTVAWSVDVLEQSIAELELQLDSLEKGNTDAADTEFKLRYEAQRDLNTKLKEQTEWYSEELSSTKEKFIQAQQRANYNLTTLCQEYSYDADLDSYTEAELSVMVRQLERQRNISYSEFRNKTWILDSRSKEYHQLKDLCDAYSGDLSFVNRSLEDMWRKRSSGGGYGGVVWSGESSIRASQRMLNPRHGPVRKTAGIRSLPRLEQDGDSYRSSRVAARTRSLDERGRRKRIFTSDTDIHRHKSATTVGGVTQGRKSASPLPTGCLSTVGGENVLSAEKTNSLSQNLPLVHRHAE